MPRAKLFRNGGSQAVRLPKECRFPRGQREVVARREGHRVVLEPPDEWPASFRSCLGAWKGPLVRPAEALSGVEDPFA
ncbi:MAG: AbrB/MazE/SpoVT family DNA-binding domain-containing protein [Elusimicrobia bacterium]|nr:AbrB/MazE/SpoVT family DNA-binding domain-containing protein [Elusimicrobiota bacterium]